MPSGRTHTMATIALGVGSLLTGQDTAVTVGILSGILLSPDLDVDEGNISLAHLRRVPFVGKTLALAWRFYWLPYALAAPHRSHISHSLIFGTLARVGYILIPVLAINFIGVPLSIPAGFGMWLIGLALADALHIFMDYTMKENRK